MFFFCNSVCSSGTPERMYNLPPSPCLGFRCPDGRHTCGRILSQEHCAYDMGVSQSQGYLIGSPIIRIIVFCSLYQGPFILGNYHVCYPHDGPHTFAKARSRSSVDRLSRRQMVSCLGTAFSTYRALLHALKEHSKPGHTNPKWEQNSIQECCCRYMSRSTDQQLLGKQVRAR